MDKTLLEIEERMTAVMDHSNEGNEIEPIIIDGVTLSVTRRSDNMSACVCSSACGSNFSQNGSCPCSSSCGSNHNRL